MTDELHLSALRCALSTLILSSLICFWGCDDEHSRFTIENLDIGLDEEMSPGQIPPDQGIEQRDMDLVDRDESIPSDMNLESPLSDERGRGIFRQGCPKSGFAHARVLIGPGELEGEAVLANEGDLLLMNDRAAFVIQDPTRPSRTWWYYGGQVVDAVPLNDCQQADEDRLNSLGMVIAEGQVTALDQATLRAFEGVRAEVISEGGGGGEARVRVYGHDAPMWLVEFELLSRAMKAGRPKLKSEELVVEMWIDYILPPDESAIRIEVGVINTLNEPRTLRFSALSFFGDKAHEYRFAPDRLDLGGISLYTGLPWLSAGNLALSMSAANMATAHFAGVDLFIDLTRFISGDRFTPWVGEDGDSPYGADVDRGDVVTWEMSLAVHEKGLSNAGLALAQRYPSPSPSRRHQPQIASMALSTSSAESTELLELLSAVNEGEDPARLTVFQRRSRVELWVFSADGVSLGQLGEHWLSAEALAAGEVNHFSIPGLLKEGETYQVRLNIPGLSELRSERFEYDPDDHEASWPSELSEVNLPPRGGLEIKVFDDQRRPLPATLRLSTLITDESVTPNGFSAHTKGELIHVIEEARVAVAAGRYRYTLTRGFEYEPVYGELEVVGGEVISLEVILRHLNPIDHYLSFDGHVHAGPSPDSDVLIIDRLRGAAAEGVEIVAGTDHEIITDWATHLSPKLKPWVTDKYSYARGAWRLTPRL